MEGFIVALLAVAALPVDSFSASVTSSPSRLPPTTLYAAHARSSANHVDAAEDFWGRPRDEGEIADFVSSAVFDGGRLGVGGAARRDGARDVEVISAEPPLLIVHGFLEHEHCDRIIDATLGPSSSSSATGDDDKHHLKRSTMGAEQEESDHRTSSTAWLREERCPTPLRTFATRTAALCGLPPTNMENLQVVRYQPGEEFQLHTDHLDSFNEYDCGGRLCTCLVYLNDSEQSAGASSEEATFTGGETNFPEFDAAITPRKGSAVFFWNTLERPGSEGYDENMFLNVDMKLRHAGLPVLSGEKWVANRWIHPREFGAGVRGLANQDVRQERSIHG